MRQQFEEARIAQAKSDHDLSVVGANPELSHRAIPTAFYWAALRRAGCTPAHGHEFDLYRYGSLRVRQSSEFNARAFLPIARHA
jgi:hypothetical protein